MGKGECCFIGPNYWFGFNKAIACYDVFHFLVNC